MADTRLIHGRYRLLDLIGRGGMGEVWQAHDESLDRRVAVKCLKPLGQRSDQAISDILRERFRREARVAASLQHHGVTVVHDFGEYQGVLYLVMEFLEGRNLSQALNDSKPHPLTVPEVVDIAAQVADALAYTHEQGIVHRDLKPANIMRLTDGTVKICDFGIARLGRDIGFTSRLTGSSVAMGTPHYMSPEQISSGPVDHRSDLYSLGCVLYEMVTGVPPFDLGDTWAILVGHRDTPPDPPRTRRADLPEAFDRIVLDLLAKTPEGRPSDAKELRRRIAAARSSSAGSASPATAPYAMSSTSATGSGQDPSPLAWSRGMTAGRKALGSAAPGIPLPDFTSGLTGVWVTAAQQRGSATAALHSPERPTPPPDTLAVLTGRHDEGLHLAVLAEREHLLGPEHPDTLASRYEVGFTLSRTGRALDALDSFGRVAEGRARSLGPDHPDTLAARQETAYVLGRLGRHFEAHQVYAAVLASRERTMGPEHPDTLRCRHNLAFNLSRLGRLEDSYRMACEVADARARVLGPAHPDTLVTRYEVAYALGQLGRWTEALVIYQEVAAARAHSLGPEHPDTLAARYEVGISLGRLGRSAEALQVYEALIGDRTRVHGAEDPETLRARHGLGVNLGRLARWDEALAVAQDVLLIRERVLGPLHPDTLVSRREVAVGLGWLDRWADALTVYRQVAEAREHVLGADHPDALASRNDEAHCLEQLGRGPEAVALYRRVAALRQRGASGPR
ncbi:serine/threonine-protein kinase [Streptomyces sp. SCSIO 30461]|uniref:serine/threonine-protein kinase n=1 Tax=Streptomyces sp. SCSIO 30461 TaxID=3118085 RepID=UPI0030CD0F36